MRIDTTEITKRQNNAELAISHIVDALESVDAVQAVTPSATQVTANTVLATTATVTCAANANDVNDFLVLPAVATVPAGHCVTVIAGVANCEVRTPASSTTKINNQNCDGTKEYLLTATQIHRFTKIDDTIGWMGQGFSALGAVVTAVIPD